MFKVTLLLWSLAIVGFLRSADGCEVKAYTQKLLPACDNNDLIIKWPNYEDQTKYYKCAQVNNPKLIDCPSGEVFVYVLQTCKPCAQYLPAVECSKLPTQNPPVCVDINAGNGGGGGSETSSPTGTVTYPTPRYPSPATTTPVSSDNTTYSADAESSVEPSENSTTTAGSTSESTTTTAFPGPPSPQATGGTTLVPIPPTPAPTPPTIELVPPTASD